MLGWPLEGEKQVFWKTGDETKEILDRHLDRDFYCVAAEDDAPSEKAVQAVATEFGCRLSKEFLVHSTGRFAGVYVEVKEEVWPRNEELAVAPFWSFLYGVFVYGLSSEVPE
jgi:hypothetical protein